MTADVELLPLPELPVAVERFILSSLGPMKREGAVTALRTMLREYALANVIHHTAPIEALRAEREVICAEALKYADKSGRLEAKVDRAAVAELMEAATDAHDFAANMARNNGEELDRRFYRLRAAILNMSS